ncbi:hypothetical protein [Spirillospora sp. NBC_01491]|uniref:hypothetical protein n=1 Tax=Spirillospora sp. NBC_01491 TaxID=2976007 RepID=UPI002E32A8A2|nr:hypothetical protein [Spirillospora sp. NBC_01491]
MTPVAQTGAGNVTTQTATTGATVTVNKPANVVDGDLLVAVLNHANGSGTWSTVPSGWTSGTTFNTGRTGGVWYKAIPSAAAEPATSYTWAATGAGSGRLGGLVLRVTGADLAAPWDAAGTWTAALGATAVTAARSDCLLLGAWWSYIASSPNTVSPPGSMSTVGSWSVSPGSSTTHTLAAETLTASGSAGARTANATPAGSSALSVLFTIAAPITGSATLAQGSALAADGMASHDGAATLPQPSELAADGQIVGDDQHGSATLAQRSALVVAEPGQSRIMSAGVWRPFTSRRMVGGTWIIEE